METRVPERTTVSSGTWKSGNLHTERTNSVKENKNANSALVLWDLNVGKNLFSNLRGNKSYSHYLKDIYQAIKTNSYN